MKCKLGFAAAVYMCLAGCVARPPLAQIDAWRTPIADGTGKPTLWYVGVGLYDESWSENDVADMAERLKSGANSFRTVSILLSNSARSSRLPAADENNLEQTTAEIARRARPGDVVMLYLSTHGGSGTLARKRDGFQSTIYPDELRRLLVPIQSLQSLIVISACFSGSLIPTLQDPNRVIITAARADRTSFGCRAGSEHTFFGEALLNAFTRPNTSIRSAFELAQENVTAMERNRHIHGASKPQVSVGSAAKALYNAHVF